MRAKDALLRTAAGGLLLAAFGTATHGEWTFTRIVGEGDGPLPGSTATVNEAKAVIDGDTIALIVWDTAADVTVYTYDITAGTFTEITTNRGIGDLLPGTGLYWHDSHPFQDIGLSGDQVVIRGQSQLGVRKGIYLYAADGSDDGTLIAHDEYTFEAPGSGRGSFTSFGSPYIKDGVITFQGMDSNGGVAIYAWQSNILGRVADTANPPPGRVWTSVFDPRVGDGRIWFHGNNGGPGIWSVDLAGGAIREEVYYSDGVPGTDPLLDYQSMDGVDPEGEDMAFRARDTAWVSGVFARRSGTMSVIADTTTWAPNGLAPFNTFSGIDLEGGKVTFSASCMVPMQPVHINAYSEIPGSLLPVLSTNDPLDGLTVKEVRLGRGQYGCAVSGDRIVLDVKLSDNSMGIYLAEWSGKSIPLFETFPLGADLLDDLKWHSSSATGTGLAEIAADPADSANGALRLYDSAGSGVEVVAFRSAVFNSLTHEVSFNYNFQTDGKLKLLIDGTLIDTISSPGGGGGWVSYENTIDLDSYGLTTGAHEVALKMVDSGGDPEVFIDDLEFLGAAPAEDYWSWITGFGLPVEDQDPEDDPNNNGLPNDVDYLIGNDPSQPGGDRPGCGMDAGSVVLSYMEDVTAAQHATCVHKWSIDLATWNSGGVTVSRGAESGGRRPVSASIPVPAGDKRFLRLEVTVDPP